MRYLPILLIPLFFAGCALKPKVTLRATPAYPSAKNHTYSIVNQYSSPYAIHVEKIVRNALAEKGYVLKSEDPDFLVLLRIDNYKIRKSMPAPASNFDAIGDSGTREYYGGFTSMEHVWKIAMDFADPVTKKPYLCAVTKTGTVKEDMGRYLDKLVEPMMRDIPRQGQRPDAIATDEVCY